MAQPWSALFSHIAGVVRYHDLAYVASVSDELGERRVVHAYLTEWDAGTWRVGDADDDIEEWEAVAATLVRQPLEQALFLGAQGEVLCMGSGDTHHERIPGARRGPLRGLGSVAGQAYACGMQYQVYRRDAGGKWRALEQGLPGKGAGAAVAGFEAIGGFAHDDLYAAGWHGEIWQCDGKRWQPCRSPVKAILTALCCAPDGLVYACGQDGALVRGRGADWEVLAQPVRDDLWSLAWFGGALYAASAHAVYRLDGGQLREIDFGADRPATCYGLSAADGVLWSIGPKDIMAFDGDTWSRID
ncbi:hypothetical protein HF313_10990 [Massilia atriviolacea]|uniref:Uncharacterized protein n=1 Tax=Massilia atriviolacea TaxID=2495579 RepID=A0A430HID2_9BURK|nr:hypothetical protein [Massilia atriviolacea]RSZ57275.1 hypothetical protein EJB06_19110 [Massilia atriviolacea]